MKSHKLQSFNTIWTSQNQSEQTPFVSQTLTFVCTKAARECAWPTYLGVDVFNTLWQSYCSCHKVLVWVGVPSGNLKLEISLHIWFSDICTYASDIWSNCWTKEPPKCNPATWSSYTVFTKGLFFAIAMSESTWHINAAWVKASKIIGYQKGGIHSLQQAFQHLYLFRICFWFCFSQNKIIVCVRFASRYLLEADVTWHKNCWRCT